MLETAGMPRAAQASALVPTEFRRRAVAAADNVEEIIVIDGRIFVVPIGRLQVARAGLVEVARSVGNGRQQWRGEAGSTHLAPTTTVRGAVHGRARSRRGIGDPIGRAAVHSRLV